MSNTSNRDNRRNIIIVWLVLMMVSASLVFGAPEAAAVPEPTSSVANNNSPMGFFASDGTAPNPTSFCESPDYFDVWNNWDNPGAAAQNGPWTTDTGPGQFGGGITATLVQNSEPIRQGQAKWGIIFGGGANGTVTISEPIFYSQWVVSDMDINGEGFEATALYNGAAAPVIATAAFGANVNHTVTTTQPNMATIVKGGGGGLQSWNFAGRSQIDFLGPIDEVEWNKTGRSGWLAGFLPSMGCAAFGSAKDVSSPATWDPATQTFSTQYTVLVRSNMPNAATIQAVLQDAADNLPASSLPAGLPEIPITGLEITDSLVVPGATIQSVATSSSTPIAANLNPAYNGDGITDLILPYDLAPETTEEIVIDVVYAPDFTDPSWADGCHSWTNQAQSSGIAATAEVGDLTDDGSDPRAAEPNGDDSVSTPTPNEVCLTPEIDITKTLNGTPVLNADGTIDVTYDLLVENLGDVDLQNVSVTDDLGAAFGAGSTFANIVTSATGPCAGETNPNFNGTGNPQLLNGGVTIPAVGATSCVITLSFLVDPGDPVILSPGTTYPNTADTSSQNGVLPEVDATDDEPFTQILPAEPSWTLTKATTSAPMNPGDTLDYTFTVVNTGNTTVSDIAIVDDKCADPPVISTESDAPDETLQLAETQVWTCTSVEVTAAEVDAGTVDNTAEVTGTPERGTIEPATSEVFTPIPAMPAFMVNKANTSMPTDAGDTIDYSFTVVNTGNVTIAGVTINDDKCATTPALASESVAENTDLDFDETQVWTCTSVPVTQAEADAGVVLNSVEVTGTPAGGTLAPATDDHKTPITADPAWSITKASTTVPGKAGDTIDYSFTLVNTGNVTIADIVLDDQKCDGGPSLDSESLDPDTELQVGETQIWKCTSIPVTQIEVDAGVVFNDVEATGTPAGGTLPPAADDHQTGIDANPSWAVTKAATTVPSAPGDTIDYAFTVVNTGNVTISDVLLVDPKCDTAIVLDSESVLPANGVLDAGETQIWTCTSVPVTTTEADLGVVPNDVEVTGNPAGGDLAPAIDDQDIPLNPAPGWTLAKSSTTVPTQPGDTIEYVFTLVNSGNVSISGIVMVDGKCAGGPTLATESVATNNILDFGETQVWTCTSVPVTQVEADAGKVDNEVSATGSPAGGDLPPAEAMHSVPLDPDPSWDIVKSNTTLPTEAGDTIEYSFTLVNTGNVSISGITLTDGKCDAAGISLDTESIAPNTILDFGETQVWRCTSVPVTLDEVNAGVVLNDVSATGAPAGGTLPPAADDHMTPVSPIPSWEIIKAAATVPTNPGETIDYTFSVVNTGNVTISGIVLTDAKCESAITIDTESITQDGLLDPGETQVWVCTSFPISAAEVDMGEVLNDVSATGTPAGGTLPPAIDDHVTPITPAPSWSIIKSTSSVPTEAGETIEYEFTVVNTGNVSIAGVTITDPKCDPATGITLDSESVLANMGVLDFDETQVWTCTSIPVTQLEVDAGVVENEAMVTGVPAAGDLPPASDENDLPIDAMPSWEIVKASTSQVTIAGERLDYSFTLVNTGNVTISGITLVDPKCETGPSFDTESILQNMELDPGETQIWICQSVPVTQLEIDEGSVNNDVSASAVSPGNLAPATDSHSVPVDPMPAMEVVKATSSTPRFEGDVLSYTFTVINTGNVTISNVIVADGKCASAVTLDSESVAPNLDLDFGETQVYSCTSEPVTQAEVDAGVVSNSVTVTGSPAGGDLSPATDDVDTPITAAPSWAVIKDTNSAPTQVGATLTYTFTVINTGNVTISNVVVDDPNCASAIDLDSESIADNLDLDYQETQVYSCTSQPVTQLEVDAGQVVNAVQVTGDPAGGDLPAAEDELITPIAPMPAFEVVKAALTTPGVVGETIDYTFTVVNTGNVTIQAVTIADLKCATTPMLDTESITEDTDLEFGETQVWSCTSMPVTQLEVDAGVVLNTVSVTGDPAGGTLAPAADDHEVPIIAAPSWEVIKAASTLPSQPGETVSYTFTVVNTGNVTITGVTVTDNKCSAPATISSESVTMNGVLEFGETQIWACTSIPVTPEEVDAGVVQNDVSVSGTPAGGDLPPAVDDHDIPVSPLPGWSVVKTATNTATAAGQTIDYEFELINTGNVSISGITLTDEKCATVISLVSESGLQNGDLDFAETQIWSCSSVPVTLEEVNAGQADNTVTVDGTPAAGELLPAMGSNILPIIPNPSWDVIKAALNAPGVAGDTIDYTFTLTNTGNVSVSGVVVADAKCDASPAITFESITGDGVLDAGETQIWACTSIPVTQTEIDANVVNNTVSVTGTPAGGTLLPATDDHVVDVTANPSWTVAKSSASTPAAPGDTLVYSFTLINTGNVTITDVVLVDAKCATTPAITFESVVSDAALQFGETQIWACTSIPVTQAEVDAGEVVNAVSVSGSPSGGDLAPAEAGHTVALLQTPDWSLTKTSDSVPRYAGDTLLYTFVLTNTGNITITNVVLVDNKCAIGPAFIDGDLNSNNALDVGEIWTYECESIPVTQDEINARQVLNEASVTGSSPNGVLPPVVSAVSAIRPNPPQAQERPISAAEPDPEFVVLQPEVPAPVRVPAPTLAHTGRLTGLIALLALTLVGMGFQLLGTSRVDRPARRKKR